MQSHGYEKKDREIKVEVASKAQSLQKSLTIRDEICLCKLYFGICKGCIIGFDSPFYHIHLRNDKMNIFKYIANRLSFHTFHCVKSWSLCLSEVYYLMNKHRPI